MNTRHVVRSTLLLAALFTVDKAVGFVRQVIIARFFGVGAALDAYNAANNLPDLLFALISGGALAIAFIPVLAEYFDQRTRTEAWALFSRVANIAFLLTAALAVVVGLLATPLVRHVVVPGFSAEQQRLVVSLMRLNLISTLLFSISGLVIAGLQANQHFALPALAPILYNVGILLGVTFLSPCSLSVRGVTLPTACQGVYGLAYGVILGAALHLAIQLPGLVRYGFRWTPRLDWSSPGVRRVARLMGPRILTLGAIQVIFLATDNLASHLGEGAVTALAYGWLILQVPETIIATAIATALLPTLSELAARGDHEGLRRALQRALAAMLGLNVPVAGLLILLVRPLVRLAFDFDARGIDLVTLAAQAYLLGLVGHALLEIAARAFYARQDARTPMWAAAGTALAFVALGRALTERYGHAGIALANTLAFTGEALVLLWLLRRRGVIFPRASAAQP